MPSRLTGCQKTLITNTYSCSIVVSELRVVLQAADAAGGGERRRRGRQRRAAVLHAAGVSPPVGLRRRVPARRARVACASGGGFDCQQRL